MARSPFSLYRRRTTYKSRYTCYVQFRDRETHRYCNGRSIARLVDLLELDPEEYPATSKAAARQVAEHWLAHNESLTPRKEPTLGDYCFAFWDWGNSEYVQAQPLRNKSIGKEHVVTNQSYIRRLLIWTLPVLVDIRLSLLQIIQGGEHDRAATVISSRA